MLLVLPMSYLIVIFSSPALYQKYVTSATPPMDEWMLCQAMRADTAGGGIDQLETHYKTFIVRRFYLIAFFMLIPEIDRKGFCGNSCSRFELPSYSDWLLGYRGS